MGAVIAFVSQKGGVGKSALARTLAREAVFAGLTVKLADAATLEIARLADVLVQPSGPSADDLRPWFELGGSSSGPGSRSGAWQSLSIASAATLRRLTPAVSSKPPALSLSATRCLSELLTGKP